MWDNFDKPVTDLIAFDATLDTIQLEQGRSMHRVRNIRRKPNKDQARRSKKESYSQNCLPLEVPVPVQFFKRYLAQRPEEMRNSGPFYLTIGEKSKIRRVAQETEDWCQ